MAIHLTCPGCGKTIAAPDHLAGKEGRCPHCRTQVKIAAGAASRSAVLPPPVPPPKPPADVADESRLSWLGKAAMFVGAIAVGALLCAVFLMGAILGWGDDKKDEASGDPVAVAAERNGAEGKGPEGTPPAGGGSELATQVHTILEKSCYACHGEGGAAEGGFNFVLRRDKLVEDSYITPGSPEDSLLLQRIKDGEMPPEGEGVAPTAEEIALITQWIEAGAPNFSAPIERTFVSNEDVFSLLRADLQATGERDRRFQRYFSLVHLANAGISDDELKTYRLAMSKLVNSLSRNRQIIAPAAVGGNENLLRIDLRDVNWTSDIWKKLTDANPYGIVFNFPDAQAVYAATETKIPVLRGDWFVAAASRPPLYHEVLQIPATLDELLATLGVDAKRNIAEDRVVRAGFNNSGVSQNNRLIERHDFRDGAVWISYDFAGNTERRNLFSHPLGPGSEEKHFLHDGGEIIFNLPNGLQGYMLVDGEGKRIDVGPTEIVSDKRRPDRQVRNGVSCMSCHYAGIIEKADEIRTHVEANRAGFQSEMDDILALYKPNADLTRLQAEDARRFQDALNVVGIERVTETNEPIVNMAIRFESNLDLALASAELGLKPEEFKSQLQAHPTLLRVLGVVNAGGELKRDVFVKVFREAVTAFKLGTPVGKVDTPTPTAADLAGAAKKETPKPPNQPAPTQSASSAAAQSPSQQEMRIWTDITGQFRVRALFVNFNGEDVRLRKENNFVVAVKINQLSEADQKFVLDQPPELSLKLPPEDKTQVAANAPQVARNPGAPGVPPPGNLFPNEPPHFGDNPYNPPHGRPAHPKSGRPEPRKVNLKYPHAELYTWHPWGFEEFAGYFHNLEAGTLYIRLPNGVVMPCPVTDMSEDDLNHIRSIMGDETFAEQFGPPPEAFGGGY